MAQNDIDVQLYMKSEFEVKHEKTKCGWCNIGKKITKNIKTKIELTNKGIFHLHFLWINICLKCTVSVFWDGINDIHCTCTFVKMRKNYAIFITHKMSSWAENNLFF